jgi:hypothetical protein
VPIGLLLNAGALALVGCATGDSRRGDETTARPGAFLAGTWRTAPENGAWTEEFWTTPSGGAMLGGSRTIGPGPDGAERLKFFEFLRIEATPDAVVYYGAPGGRSPPTPFRMVERSATRIAFENPAHDFPKRISYWLDDTGRLHASVGGLQQEAADTQHWVFDRVAAPPAPPVP